MYFKIFYTLYDRIFTSDNLAVDELKDCKLCFCSVTHTVKLVNIVHLSAKGICLTVVSDHQKLSISNLKKLE